MQRGQKLGLGVGGGHRDQLASGRQFQERIEQITLPEGWAMTLRDGRGDAIARLEAIAWEALQDGRKAPLTQPAGREFADPTYPISMEWLQTRQRLKAAQAVWSDSASPSRVLLICGSGRRSLLAAQALAGLGQFDADLAQSRRGPLAGPQPRERNAGHPGERQARRYPGPTRHRQRRGIGSRQSGRGDDFDCCSRLRDDDP